MPVVRRPKNEILVDAMTSDAVNANRDAAFAMLDSFVSVAADGFDLTANNRNGDKVAFRRAVTPETLRGFLPTMLKGVAKNQQNLIVLPLSRRVLSMETIPGNFQAWVALDALARGGLATVRRAASPQPLTSKRLAWLPRWRR